MLTGSAVELEQAVFTKYPEHALCMACAPKTPASSEAKAGCTLKMPDMLHHLERNRALGKFQDLQF